MIIKTLLGLALTAAWLPSAWAAETFHPLDVKTGEWETTSTVSTNGPPPIPAEALARMTDQQRAMLEEKTKSLSGRTMVQKFCLTKDKLDKPLIWRRDDKSCTNTLVSSTGSTQEIHVECSRENRKSTGTIRLQALNSENVKGTVKMTLAMGDHTSEINSTFTAKYIGATCSAKEN